MELTIDEIIQGIQVIKAQAEWDYPLDWQIVLDGAIDTMRKYQQLQADYENRLKADLKAILVELQMEIEESENCGKAFHLGLQMASNIIQQKINELPAVTPQEPTDKIFTKAELDSIVKAINSGWELRVNEVLDKLRAEIETKYGRCDICEYFENYDYEENDISEYRPIGNISDILQIIDKYKTESEG